MYCITAQSCSLLGALSLTSYLPAIDLLKIPCWPAASSQELGSSFNSLLHPGESATGVSHCRCVSVERKRARLRRSPQAGLSNCTIQRHLDMFVLVVFYDKLARQGAATQQAPIIPSRLATCDFSVGISDQCSRQRNAQPSSRTRVAPRPNEYVSLGPFQASAAT